MVIKIHRWNVKERKEFRRPFRSTFLVFHDGNFLIPCVLGLPWRISSKVFGLSNEKDGVAINQNGEFF